METGCRQVIRQVPVIAGQPPAAIANEENSLADMELEGHLEGDATSRVRKDIE